MGKHLVIVESPTKAKTIRGYLGKDFEVIASMGHVRDLPANAAEIPANAKKEEWATLGVNAEHDFEPLYIIPRGKKKNIDAIKKALKDAEDLYLATDEDREGESISWHLLEVLKPKVPVKRLAFHEITKRAIEKALEQPRDIDENLVRAQETRRILDRLVGYTVSPVLWKKLAYGLSAGRVQSAALKALVDRERERIRFKAAQYWDVEAKLRFDDVTYDSKLTETAGEKVATGKDFDEATGTLKAAASKHKVVDEATAKSIAKEVLDAEWKVADRQEKNYKRKTPSPFTTSTLQQEANRKLGLSSSEAMRVAQSLYEKGHITYMRTDSVALSDDAVRSVRKNIESRFGKEFVPENAKIYTTKAKSAQEAHEAIRPSLNFSSPSEIGLSGAERSLYELIWMRTLASQMKDAELLSINIQHTVNNHVFQSNGTRILFPGFLRAYVEGSDDVDQALGEKENVLPDIGIGDAPECTETNPLSHETKPPRRFTEASLVQFMEQKGIGRPSTYASVISTLQNRDYVHKVSNALVPTLTGFGVTQLLETHFPDLVDIKFTSNMEDVLDNIASGKEEWLPYLKDFYFGDNGLKELVDEKTEDIDPKAAKAIELSDIEGVQIKIGRFGPYVEKVLPNTGETVKSSLPKDLAPDQINEETIDEVLKQAQQGPTSLGIDPESGKQVLLKTGLYGPYLQLGEAEEPEEGKKKPKKPKRGSIPKNVSLEELDLELALKILSLPRLLGKHPETGEEIRAGVGRFGPYIVHDGDFRSLKEDDVLEIQLDRALEILAQPKRGRGGAKKPGKTLGKHPKDDKPITLHDGRYGPYVKHGKTNASIPKDSDPDKITLEEAVALLDEKKSKKKKK